MERESRAHLLRKTWENWERGIPTSWSAPCLQEDGEGAGEEQISQTEAPCHLFSLCRSLWATRPCCFLEAPSFAQQMRWGNLWNCDNLTVLYHPLPPSFPEAQKRTLQGRGSSNQHRDSDGASHLLLNPNYRADTAHVPEDGALPVLQTFFCKTRK